jgi:hypothetical protein
MGALARDIAYSALIVEVFYWPIIYGLLSGKHT